VREARAYAYINALLLSVRNINAKKKIVQGAFNFSVITPQAK